MANPLVPQGFLNRVRGAVSVTGDPSLNVTASFLGKEGVSLRPDGPATDILPTMTGTVGSQAPYQQVTLTVHLLKTQALAAAYQNRFATDTSLGEIVVTPDANTFGNYTVLNSYLVNFNEITMNGMDPGYAATISGYIITNDNMWV
ncbi:hypothetical protein [Yersinia enterocolitica]|uniref:hypothetical protein n=1 Tax=Yersinia enterocolitica TaxID=630 RepID=UPI001C6102A2|nr:hypothetical protein [Yersinia enterocolitica]MBW5857350.1 hypothetical protein [Yersinia enterocolitica]MBW5861694.1 hypothetical protein [Yersinia enterocolitica]